MVRERLCTLQADGFLLAEIYKGPYQWYDGIKIIKTQIKFPGVKIIDIQEDGGFIHDESFYEYDEDKFTIVDLMETQELNLCNLSAGFVDPTSLITKIEPIKLIDFTNLEEVE